MTTRPLGFHKRKWLKNELRELLKAKVIRPSRSPYAAAPVIVEKKDGSYRLAIDYRKINEYSEDFLYPLPKQAEIFDCFAGAEHYTTLDLARGYWQIAMEEGSIPYTAFITPYGQFEFLMMPFGLKQAPGWFQLLMNHVLHEVIGEICVVYLDDIIIYSKTKEQHLKDVKIVLELLHKAVLQIKLKKCKFFKKEIPFLGHIISKEGIKTDPEKIRAMQEMKPPTCLKDVQAILGLFQYYKSFIRDFARIAAPIYKALKRQPKFIWRKEQQEAFETLKRKMTEAPILAHPDYDKPFILYSDDSYSGLGHILAQKGTDDKEHVILYGGRKLQPAEQNYTITELECLGVVWGVRKNKQFLGQNNFLLFTDHKALETLRKQALPSIPRRTRWILELEQYNYTIKHRPGKKMSHVDYLSRYQETYAVSFDDKLEYINGDFANWEEPIQEPPSRWEELNFTYNGKWQQCQLKKWNPKYHDQMGSCYQEGHHTHYYCKKCKHCFNPNGWWKKPTEE
ncbi:MAG: reverse transcriptase family protein, partial [Nitrososphaeraceae archaeon]|nr:reverse transcriptase family protein [Nitrososphaeraceae archaeon]